MRITFLTSLLRRIWNVRDNKKPFLSAELKARRLVHFDSDRKNKNKIVQYKQSEYVLIILEYHFHSYNVII